MQLQRLRLGRRPKVGRVVIGSVLIGDEAAPAARAAAALLLAEDLACHAVKHVVELVLQLSVGPR